MGLHIKEWMTSWRFGKYVIELGHIGDDGLLVWFGGINICKLKKLEIRKLEVD